MKREEINPELQSYIRERLQDIVPVFARAAVGDFSGDVKIPEKDNELVEFYAGVQMMLEVVREKLAELQSMNQLLEKKVEERTSELVLKNDLLKKQTDLYETLLTAQSEMGEGVAITEEKKVIYVNEALSRIYGYSVEELLGMDSFFSIVAPEYRADLADRLKLRMAGESGSDAGETVVIRKDGKRIFVEYSVKPMHVGDNRILISIMRDVTGKKETEEFLKREEERAERAEVARNVSEMFLANISHEIRTPMNAIMGFAGLLEDEVSTAEQKKYIEIIKKSGDNLLVIINDILDLSRLQAGKMHISKSGFEIPSLISNSMEMVRMRAEAKGILLSKQIDPELDIIVEGDAVRLGQVLLNLLSNAVKFTPEGKVEVSAALVKKDRSSVTALIRVSDTGIGIPEHELPYIFERFGKAGNNLKKNQEGTGIGLAITKHLVELQGGTIKAESTEGEGSIFSFTLTFSKPSASATANDSSVKNVRAERPVMIRALVVEDNEVNTELMKILFRKWNYSIETAGSGELALQKITEQDFDIILMDLKMPGIDGYETIRRIRMMEGKKQLPVIAVTAHAIEGEKEKCLAAGMNDYLSKPFSPADLQSKIISCVKTREKELRTGAAENNGLREAYQVIDLSYLESVTKGNAEQQKKIISLFIQNSPGMIGEMVRLSEEKKYNELAGLVHKFRSGAVNFYSGAQSEFFMLLEGSCRAGKDMEILKAIKFLITLNDQALKELRLELETLPEKYPLE